MIIRAELVMIFLEPPFITSDFFFRSKVSLWCFLVQSPERIISGLKETFIKRYIVEWANKAEIRPEEQGEKRRVVGKIYGMKFC